MRCRQDACRKPEAVEGFDKNVHDKRGEPIHAGRIWGSREILESWDMLLENLGENIEKSRNFTNMCRDEMGKIDSVLRENWRKLGDLVYKVSISRRSKNLAFTWRTTWSTCLGTFWGGWIMYLEKSWKVVGNFVWKFGETERRKLFITCVDSLGCWPMPLG